MITGTARLAMCYDYNIRQYFQTLLRSKRRRRNPVEGFTPDVSPADIPPNDGPSVG